MRFFIFSFVFNEILFLGCNKKIKKEAHPGEDGEEGECNGRLYAAGSFFFWYCVGFVPRVSQITKCYEEQKRPETREPEKEVQF